jgi:hypothetical protein
LDVCQRARLAVDDEELVAQRRGRAPVPREGGLRRGLHGPRARPPQQFAARRLICAHARRRRTSSGGPCGGDRRGGAGGPPSKHLHASCGHCPAFRAARCGSLKPRRRKGCASAEPAANDRPSQHCGTVHTLLFITPLAKGLGWATRDMRGGFFQKSWQHYKSEYSYIELLKTRTTCPRVTLSLLIVKIHFSQTLESC